MESDPFQKVATAIRSAMIRGVPEESRVMLQKTADYRWFIAETFKPASLLGSGLRRP